MGTMKVQLVSLERALLAGVSAVNHLCICSCGASDVVYSQFNAQLR